MTTYRFDDITAHAPLFPGTSIVLLDGADTVTFNGGSANLASVVYGRDPIGIDTVTIGFGGHSAVFDAAIQGVSANRHLVFDDGSNLIVGGPRDETFQGGPGNDAMFGGGGNDALIAMGGNNVLQGNSGADSLSSAGGRDTLFGGQGDDLIVTGLGDTAGASSDFAQGNLGNDTVIGGSAGDTLLGGQGDDSIQGGGGGDWISGDRGNDTATGGTGADAFFIASNGGDDRILDFNGAEGDRVHVQAGTALEFHQVGADTLILVDHGASTTTLAGVQMSTLDPAWFVSDGGVATSGDTIIGSEVNDVLLGDRGADSIQGGGGADWMTGGLGDDTLLGGAGGDAFFATANSGDDRVLDFNGADGDRVRVEATKAFEIHQDGNDTLILIDHGSSTMRLVGIQASSLHADWVVGV